MRSLELHEVWFGALYVVASALLINVFTGNGGEWTGAGTGAVLSSISSLVLLALVGKMRIDCQKRYKAAIEQIRPDQTKVQIYEKEVGSRHKKADRFFIGALAALLVAVVLWVILTRNRSADERRAERELRTSIESISEAMERHGASIDTLSERVRDVGAETRALGIPLVS